MLRLVNSWIVGGTHCVTIRRVRPISILLWYLVPYELLFLKNRGIRKLRLFWLKDLFVGDALRWAYAQLRMLVNYRVGGHSWGHQRPPHARDVHPYIPKP